MAHISLMIDTFQYYYTNCFRDVPKSLLWGLIIVFSLGSIAFVSFLGGKRGMKCSLGLLLIEYLFLILLLSVLVRKVQAERVVYAPFWSYRVISANETHTLVQVINNICAYVPVGVLLCCVFDKIKWWNVLIIGGGFSSLIETLQYVLKLGFTEFDDVFHNVLGCLIGYILYLGFIFLIKAFKA